MAICAICGKHTQFGSSQQHRRGVAGKRWKKRAQATKRTFKPNLQKKTIEIDGKLKKVYVCTNCLKRRRYEKSQSIALG